MPKTYVLMNKPREKKQMGSQTKGIGDIENLLHINII